MIKDPYKISAIRSQRLAFPFYFLSDTHLSTYSDVEQDKRLKRVLDLLDEVKKSKGTLFILGDFFDFWFDKGSYVPERLQTVINALVEIIELGMEIHFIAGNHDYWIKGFLTRKIGIEFYPNAIEFEYDSKHYFLHHGDGVLSENKLYPLARKIMRSWWAIALLKLLPIKWTYALGEKVSNYNQLHDNIPSAPEKYILKMQEYLLAKNAEGYDLAISGHVHSPSILENHGRKAVILGDWIHSWTYGFMDESGFELRKIF